MRYIITPGGIQFPDDDPPEISMIEAVRVLQGISQQIETLGNESKPDRDAEIRVDSQTRDREPAPKAA